MYLKKRYVAGSTIEIQKTISTRYGITATRREKTDRTPEAVQKYNGKMARRQLIRIINANFTPGDIYLTLTYRRGERPREDEAVKDRSRLLRRLQGKVKKRGGELKYIAVTAIGSKGGIHHHLVLGGTVAEDLRGLWDKGRTDIQYLYEDGHYEALAAYLIDQEARGPGGQGGIIGRRWSGSRNLIIPEPEIEVVDADTWREPPEAELGYVIDVASIEAGTSPVSGQPYLYYRMLRADDKVITQDGRVLKGRAAHKYQKAKNKEEIRREMRKRYDAGTIQVLRRKQGKAKKPRGPDKGMEKPPSRGGVRAID